MSVPSYPSPGFPAHASFLLGPPWFLFSLLGSGAWEKELGEVLGPLHGTSPLGGPREEQVQITILKERPRGSDPRALKNECQNFRCQPFTSSHIAFPPRPPTAPWPDGVVGLSLDYGSLRQRQKEHLGSPSGLSKSVLKRPRGFP